ncbi:dTDP-4-dehydrorhamnose reductase [Luteimonas sp. SDU101]|uniref:dTDP-4-dehydrorhamnose reductase n=1 Tax=unclassified Luteimonas TaxID=2629088 RepID=UPI003EBF7C63
MKILLLGANGQVGYELRRALGPIGGLVCATRDGRLQDGGSCEIANLDEPHSLRDLVRRIGPDVVVNAAAYTAVDRAETDRDSAFRSNAEAVGVLADACAERDALLVHYSTDYVFDGSGTRPYREDDPVSPLGAYGASKLAGEQAVQSGGARHFIFRTAWVYADRGSNFMLTMLRLARERDELRVVADQTGTPTPAALIADVTASILARPFERSGLWHLTAQGETTWHGFASAIFARAQARGLIAHAPRVVPIATADYPTPARRPAYSRLDCSRLERDFGIVLPEWRAALDAVLS